MAVSATIDPLVKVDFVNLVRVVDQFSIPLPRIGPATGWQNVRHQDKYDLRPIASIGATLEQMPEASDVAENRCLAFFENVLLLNQATDHNPLPTSQHQVGFDFRSRLTWQAGVLGNLPGRNFRSDKHQNVVIASDSGCHRQHDANIEKANLFLSTRFCRSAGPKAQSLTDL